MRFLESADRAADQRPGIRLGGRSPRGSLERARLTMASPASIPAAIERISSRAMAGGTVISDDPQRADDVHPPWPGERAGPGHSVAGRAGDRERA